MPGVPLSFIDHEKDLKLINEKEDQQKPGRHQVFKLAFYSFLTAVLIISCVLFYSTTSHSTIVTHFRKVNPYFTGRQDYLAQLKKTLVKKKMQQTVLVALYGNPGVGKSEIAAAFIKKYDSYFSYVFWINANSEETLKESYCLMADALNISKDDSRGNPVDLVSLCQKIHYFLENKHLHKPWLIIFDGAECHPDYIPSKGGAVLVTCQQKVEWSYDLEIEVEPNPIEAIELFHRITGEEKTQVMEKLAQELDYLPLLIQYVGRFIKESPELNVKLFYNLIKNDKEFIFSKLNTNQSKPIPETYDYILSKIIEQNPLTLEFLEQFASLYSDDIPIDLAYEWFKHKGVNQDLVFQQILRELKVRSLIHFQKDKKVFSIHRLLQDILRRRVENSSYNELLKIFLNYSAVKDYNPTHEESVIPFKAILPHCVALINSVKTPSLYHSRLLLIIARYFLDTEKNLPKAIEYLNLAEKNTEYIDHPIQGRIAFLKGMLYREKSFILKTSKEELLKLALSYFQKSREVFNGCQNIDDYQNLEQNAEKCNPKYQRAISLLFQAQIFNELSELKQAESLLLKALQEYMEVSPDGEHFDIARIIREQGIILRKQGKLQEAREKMNHALSMQKRVYGARYDSQPSVAATLRMLGDLCFDLNDFQQADCLYEQAIQVNQKAYKIDFHPYILELYQKREKSLRKLGKNRLASKMAQRFEKLQKKIDE